MNELQDTVIFDLDGTICCVNNRIEHVKDGNKDYEKFHLASQDSPARLAELTLIKKFIDDPSFKVIIFTGRPVKYEDLTINWLENFGINTDEITLIMRPNNDLRPDVEYKREIINIIGKSRILFVIEDRKRVVDMWRSEGIKCLHCDVGDY